MATFGTAGVARLRSPLFEKDFILEGRKGKGHEILAAAPAGLLEIDARRNEQLHFVRKASCER